MRRTVVFLPLLLLMACSSAPKEETKAKAKEPEKVEPLTGKSAFYKMYPTARTWASDCKGLQLKSHQLPEVKAEAGRAGAWTAVFVSESKGRMKTFTWSAVDSEGNFKKGVWPGAEQSFTGRLGQAYPFFAQALKVDSDEAYKTALTKDDPYLKRPSAKTDPINFLVEFTPPRFPDATWRVLWGESVGTANYSAFVNAATGQFLEKGR
jgi:hypothetical protein